MKYSYIETDNGFHIVREDKKNPSNSGTIATVEYKRSAELIVSELNSRIDTSHLDLYEIYIYNPEDITEGVYEGRKAGTVSGWEIKWVFSTPQHIHNFPYFDCVITKNDGTAAQRAGAILFPS